MKSLVVLEDDDGRPLLGLQVLCGGVPCRAESTGRRNNVRFVSRAAGELSFVLSNGGPRLVHFDLQKASLTPGQDWGDAPADCAARVNLANLVQRGTACRVERDESTGRAMLAEPMRGADGKPVREVHAELRGLARTKWRLKVHPAIPNPHHHTYPWSSHRLFPRDLKCLCFEDYKKDVEQFKRSSWVLLDGGQDDVDAEPMTVVTPTVTVLMPISARARVADVKKNIESSLGIPRAEQRLLSYDGRQLKDEDAVAAAKRDHIYAKVFVRGATPQPGPNIWFHIEVMACGNRRFHKRDRYFYSGRSSDTTVLKVRELVDFDALPDHRVFLGGVELFHGLSMTIPRPLLVLPFAYYGVRAGSTLTVRLRGPTSLTVVLPGQRGERVQVWADLLRDRVYHLCARIGQARYGRPDACALTLDGVELDAVLPLADAGVTPGTTLQAVYRGASPTFQLFVRNLAGSTRCVEVAREDPVGAVKEELQCEEGIPVGLQKLIFAGVVLEDDRPLSDYPAVAAGSTLQLGLRMRCGVGLCEEEHVKARDDEIRRWCVVDNSTLAAAGVPRGPLVPHAEGVPPSPKRAKLCHHCGEGMKKSVKSSACRRCLKVAGGIFADPLKVRPVARTLPRVKPLELDVTIGWEYGLELYFDIAVDEDVDVGEG